mmetsp:Transcript_11009/g.24915  ORF Transcript_11009/g.24915 Transcript_11009/m.24915 type:complete len:201 (+) Transcript_11009:655-1257(+)
MLARRRLQVCTRRGGYRNLRGQSTLPTWGNALHFRPTTTTSCDDECCRRRWRWRWRWCERAATTTDLAALLGWIRSSWGFDHAHGHDAVIQSSRGNVHTEHEWRACSLRYLRLKGGCCWDWGSALSTTSFYCRCRQQHRFCWRSYNATICAKTTLYYARFRTDILSLPMHAREDVRVRGVGWCTIRTCQYARRGRWWMGT